MTPLDQTARARGGSARTPAKLNALRKLHASRRGVRVNTDTRERQSVLADVQALIRDPVPGVTSLRAVARHCRVDPRTVGRWLSGEDWPPTTQVRRMRGWVKANQPA
jgi:hypothetical protein